MIIKIQKANSGFGLKGVIIAITIICLVGLVVFAWFNNTVAASKNFINTYHQDLRTKTGSEVYSVQCPEMRDKLSLNEFSQFQSKYKSQTDKELSFELTTSKLNMDSIRDTSTLNGSFVSLIYRTGTVDVGVLLKETENSYCVFRIFVAPL